MSRQKKHGGKLGMDGRRKSVHCARDVATVALLGASGKCMNCKVSWNGGEKLRIDGGKTEGSGDSCVGGWRRRRVTVSH